MAVLLLSVAAALFGCSGGSESAGTEAEAGGAGDASQVSEAADGAADYGSLELTMGSTGAADDISTQAMTYMKEYIEEKVRRSHYRQHISILPAGGGTDQLEMTGQGSIDLFLEANFMTSNGVMRPRWEVLPSPVRPKRTTENKRK